MIAGTVAPWRVLTCQTCGAEFTVPKRAGRPPAYCSDGCRPRGKHARFRHGRADAGPAVVAADGSVRHGRGPTEAERLLADAFPTVPGEPVPASFSEGGPDAAWGRSCEAARHRAYREAGRHGREPLEAIYGLRGSPDEGSTCKRRIPVIGQNLHWRWQEFLSEGYSISQIEKM